MSRPSDRPSRFDSVSNRIADEYNDILDAELSSELRRWIRYPSEEPRDLHQEVRSSYDETQALEILAVEPGWLNGERFYLPTYPSIPSRGEDMFIQDFGFGPYLRNRPVEWRSILEEITLPAHDPDSGFAEGFFIGATKSDEEVHAEIAAARVEFDRQWYSVLQG